MYTIGKNAPSGCKIMRGVDMIEEIDKTYEQIGGNKSNSLLYSWLLKCLPDIFCIFSDTVVTTVIT